METRHRHERGWFATLFSESGIDSRAESFLGPAKGPVTVVWLAFLASPVSRLSQVNPFSIRRGYKRPSFLEVASKTAATSFFSRSPAREVGLTTRYLIAGNFNYPSSPVPLSNQGKNTKALTEPPNKLLINFDYIVGRSSIFSGHAVDFRAMRPGDNEKILIHYLLATKYPGSLLFFVKIVSVVWRRHLHSFNIATSAKI